jgi:hypothetical protein
VKSQAPEANNDREKGQTAKDPLNSAFLDGGVLLRTHAVCCRAKHPPRALTN